MGFGSTASTRLKTILRVAPQLLLVSPLIGISALHASEGSVPPSGITSLSGVTATATRSSRNAFDIAESVSVIDAETIEQSQASTVGELLEGLANIEISGGPRSVGQNISIRGLGEDRLLLLVDGARQSYSRTHDARLFIEPDLLKQAEVLRGPASALWGSGALGGVVSFTTKDAADMLASGQTSGMLIKSGYQGVNQGWLTSGASYGLVGDSLDYLINLSYRQGDDVDLGDGSRLDHSAFESLAGLGKVTWTPDSFNTLSASLNLLNDERDVPSNPQDNVSGTNPLVDRDTQQTNFTLNYRYENPNHKLLQPSVLIYRNHTEVDESRTPDPREDETELTTTGIDLRNVMQLGSDSIAPQVITIGIDYTHDQTESQRDGVPRPGFPEGESDIFGIYLQDEITMGALSLTPGLRWDHYENESSGNVADDQSESELSTKFGISWQINDWLSLHGAYGEAFRAPSLSELFVTGTHFTCGPGCANLFVPNPNLKPEQASNKEAGFRLRKDGLFMAADKARFRATYFHNNVDDFIDLNVNFTFAPVVGNPGAGGVTSSSNVDKARLYGYEFELSYDQPRWYGGLTYAQTRGKDEASGESLSSVPADEWGISAGLKFTSLGLRMGWQTRIVDEQKRVPTGATTSDSYTLHNLRMTWQPTPVQLQGLRIDFGIDNLTDRDYRPHLSLLQAPGRNIKTSLSYRY